MSYILKLAGWYPSRVDAFSGDFVQRHATSIACCEKIIVLFLVKDPSLKNGPVEIHRSASGRLIEYVVYYSAGGALQRVRSLFRYISLGLKMVRQITNEHGTPALVHVSVVWKAGLLALALKKRYGWKYVLTEHWTGYTRENPQGLHAQGPIVQWWYRQVYTKAALFLPVSADMAVQVRRWFPIPPVEVVPNTVDTRLFRYIPPAAPRPGEQTPDYVPTSGAAPNPPQQSATTPDLWRLIHVSGMGYQKNIDGILRVLEKLAAIRRDLHITLVGPYPPQLRETLSREGLLDTIVFLTGEISYPEVARLMQESHLLFLFSRYEHQPCVLLEALCCGLPVVATRVGGVPEIIGDHNGILVDSEREDQLLAALQRMLDIYSRFDRSAIAADARRKFSYAAVGGQYSRIYRRLTEQLPPQDSPSATSNESPSAT